MFTVFLDLNRKLLNKLYLSFDFFVDTNMDRDFGSYLVSGPLPVRKSLYVLTPRPWGSPFFYRLGLYDGRPLGSSGRLLLRVVRRRFWLNFCKYPFRVLVFIVPCQFGCKSLPSVCNRGLRPYK